jgi:F-type H+-transporting ATPase subunit c
MYPALPIGVGICLMVAGLAGLGMGLATGKAVDAVSRQPEASGKISSLLLIGLAITESCAIYGLVAGILMIFSLR